MELQDDVSEVRIVGSRVGEVVKQGIGLQRGLILKPRQILRASLSAPARTGDMDIVGDVSAAAFGKGPDEETYELVFTIAVNVLSMVPGDLLRLSDQRLFENGLNKLVVWSHRLLSPVVGSTESAERKSSIHLSSLSKWPLFPLLKLVFTRRGGYGVEGLKWE